MTPEISELIKELNEKLKQLKTSEAPVLVMSNCAMLLSPRLFLITVESMKESLSTVMLARILGKKIKEKKNGRSEAES